MWVIPVKLPQELENFVDSAFAEGVVHKMPNEEFDVSTLFLLTGCTFRRIRLSDHIRSDKYGKYCFRILCVPDNRHSLAAWSDVDQGVEGFACASSTPARR